MSMNHRSLDVMPACLNPENVRHDAHSGWGSDPTRSPPVAGWWLLWATLGLIVWSAVGLMIWHAAGPTVCLLWADGSWSCLG